MPNPTVTQAPARTERSLERLHAFLSLEAPFLLGCLSGAEAPEEIETVLLSSLEDLVPRDDGFASTSLFPLLTQREARDGYLDELRLQVRGFFERERLRQAITRDERLEIFQTMLLTRALDDAMKRSFDAKQIAWEGYPSPQKGFRSIGQEAIAGAAVRLRRGPAFQLNGAYTGDYIAPIIRDLAALLMFLPDPAEPLRIQFGKRGSSVDGRDLHTGDLDRGVVHSAAPLAVASQTLLGIAFALKQRQSDQICVSFIGEGGSSLGEWHEAVNFAAVQRLNMIFVVENNHWALGTHVHEQSAVRRFAAKAAGYGIPGISLFGNDPDEICAGVCWAAERARRGDGPTLIELVTYRRGGHAHHDDDRYRGRPEIPIEGYELEQERLAWERADPIELYERRLLGLGLVDHEAIALLRSEVDATIEGALAEAGEADWPEPEDYLDREFAPAPPPIEPRGPAESRLMTYDEAIRSALGELLAADPRVCILGEDVGGRYGGAFGVTRGLARQFGPERCLNTPLAESAIVGCGVGAALVGMRPIVEMQFADFLAPAFNALVNNAAKNYWRWGHAVPLVVRLPYGCATGTMERLLGGGPFHSQCPEMWFLRTPGWKIVAPSTPADAKGLLLAAVRDPNPVIFLEAKGLYGFFRRDLRERVALGTDWEVPIGQAAVRREGMDLTVLTYGPMVWTALEAAERLAGEASLEVVDLRTLWPLDEDAIYASVAKTHRALVLHEDTRRGGLAGELTALLNERVFFELDAPVRRVTAPDTPVPYSPPLERHFLPKAEDVVREARALLAV